MVDWWLNLINNDWINELINKIKMLPTLISSFIPPEVLIVLTALLGVLIVLAMLRIAL